MKVNLVPNRRRKPTLTLDLFGLGEEYRETLDPKMPKDLGRRTNPCGAYLAVVFSIVGVPNTSRGKEYSNHQARSHTAVGLGC
jgi:hypothetical protein